MIGARLAGVGRRCPKSPEAGLGLAELIVTIMLGLLVLTMVASLYISTAKSVYQSRNTNESTAGVSNAVNELNRVIRFGTENPRATVSQPDPAFLSAEREGLTLYSDVDVDASVKPVGAYPKPQIVRFAIDATSRQLIESRWSATASGEFWTFPNYPGTATSSRNLGGVFAPGTTTPLFTYYDANGAAITTPVTGSMSTALLKTVASVKVTVTMRAASNPNAPFVTVVNTITMPNLGRSGVVS
ncbi:hypothetical protein WDJ51_06985 [Rathayibacter sp. YIM 133350]|uniref:hypothetical protein n=1 Tax=Rathayibacter sp. YIM 133350 TaxID=3131992 RepID=UPI00307D94EA